MPKITLSDDQRARILAGATELDIGEATPVPGASATPPATPPAPVIPAVPAAPAPSTDLVAYLTGQVAEKDTALITAKAELANAKVAADAAVANQDGLVKIAQAVVGQMQVALGNTDSAAALSAKDVVAEYERVLPVYKAKLPTGGVSQPTPEAAVPDAHPRFTERLALIATSK